jgi:hypothetical protein
MYSTTHNGRFFKTLSEILSMPVEFVELDDLIASVVSLIVILSNSSPGSKMFSKFLSKNSFLKTFS